MTPQDKQELPMEEAIKELREMLPEHECIRIRVQIDCAWFGGDVVETQARIIAGRLEWFGKTLSEAMGHVRNWNEVHARRFFCSCGAACTATEYAEHRKRGHDSGL